jgi:hypothetical protein
MSSGVAQTSPARPLVDRVEVGSPRAGSLWSSRVLPYTILVAAVAIVAVPFWPGRMNADTLTQIIQLKTGLISDQYTPVLENLWRPLFLGGFGPGWVLTGQLMVFVGGAYLILRLVFGRLAAAILVAFVCVTPMAFGELGLVGRDTWFLSLLVGSFGTTVRVFSTRGRERLAWVAATLVLTWLATASRQNAAASSFIPLALIAGLLLTERRPSMATRQVALSCWAIALGVIVTIAMLGSQLLFDDATGVVATHSSAQLFLYDLASLSRQDGRDYIPTVVLPSRSMRTIDDYSSVASINGMLFGAGAPVAYPWSGKVASDLESAWIHRIEADPLGYLRDRLSLMGQELGLTQDSIWVYHPYIDPNSLGYSTRFTGADRLANDWMQAFSDSLNNGGVLFAPWIYLLACLVVAVVCLRRPTRPHLLIGAIALSALAYQVGLLFGLMGTNYRYEFPVVTVSELVIALALGLAWQRFRAARSGQTSSPIESPQTGSSQSSSPRTA